MVFLTQTWAIVEAICDAFNHVVTTCIINQCHGYYLLSIFLTLIIKLYVQISKDRLKLQAKIDVPKDMDMCTNMKQLGTNMWEQVAIILRPFLDFMDCFKILKVHNMLAFMLDP
jgi:hypothetical protein